MEPCAVRRVCIPVDDIQSRRENRRTTVLLVTGDSNLRAAAGRCLEEAGCRVLPAAHSGHALLAALTSSSVDLLVTELSLEEISGPALAQRIRRDHPDLHAIYLAPSGTQARGGVLVRPFTREDLLEAVATALARRAISSPPA